MTFTTKHDCWNPACIAAQQAGFACALCLSCQITRDAFAAQQSPLERKIDDLIARSSLGTPEAIAVRAGADPAVVERTLQRADQLARKGRT